MFHKGDYIIYGSKGVCEVTDVTTIDRDGKAGDRLYYLLTPMNARGNKVFTPVDNDKTVMRPLISRTEAEGLIQEIPTLEMLEITSERQREQSYKECMRTGSCRDYMRIIKTLYQRKKMRLARGKKITSTDERYLKMAEDALYSELAVLFSIPREEVPIWLRERMMRNSEESIG